MAAASRLGRCHLATSWGFLAGRQAATQETTAGRGAQPTAMRPHGVGHIIEQWQRLSDSATREPAGTSTVDVVPGGDQSLSELADGRTGPLMHADAAWGGGGSTTTPRVAVRLHCQCTPAGTLALALEPAPSLSLSLPPCLCLPVSLNHHAPRTATPCYPTRLQVDTCTVTLLPPPTSHLPPCASGGISVSLSPVLLDRSSAVYASS